MKKASMITGQIFRLQLSQCIVSHLIDSGLIVQDDKQIESAIRSLSKLFKDGVDLEDFSFDFTITDLYDNKKFIA